VSSRISDRPFWLPWRPGPVPVEGQPVVVSLTDFRAGHARHLTGIYARGLRLREGWYALPGAVGMWLWALPLAAGRGGSVSVWESDDALRAFVRLPAHVEIMRRYRDLGTLRSHTWSMAPFDSNAVRQTATEWILDGAPGRAHSGTNGPERPLVSRHDSPAR